MNKRFLIPGLLILAAILALLINKLEGAIVLPPFITHNILLLLSLLVICLVASIYIGQVIEQLTQQSGSPPSHPPTKPPVQAASLPTGPGKRYLTTVVLGVLLSLVSLLSMYLIPILAGVDPLPTPLQVLPSLVMSLIAGVTLGKSRAGLPASLLTGLIIGISAGTFMVVKYVSILPSLPQYAWVLIIIGTLACGPLSWLVAWLSTYTGSI